MDNESSSPPIQPITPAPPIPDPNERDARTWAMWCHLSALSGLFVPGGHVVGPLLVWQLKKDQFPSLNEHGREAVNFQLSLLIYLVGGGIAAFLGVFACGIGLLLIPVLGVIGVAGMVFSIIAGVKANEGGFYPYPMNLRLIK